ncbi:MAG: NAD-dependent epimerase/dehydratase family protein, partial [Flavobacteriales bacterium]
MDSSKQPQVLITGAAGFIGGALSRYAIEAGYRAIGVDDFNRTAEQLAWRSIPFQECIDREAFIKNPDRWLSDVKAIFHLGART